MFQFCWGWIGFLGWNVNGRAVLLVLSRILLGFIGFSWGLSKFLACIKFLGCLLSCVFFSSGFYRLFGDGKMAAVGFGSLDSLGPAGKLSTDFYSANYRQRRVLETGRGDDWPFHKTLNKKKRNRTPSNRKASIGGANRPLGRTRSSRLPANRIESSFSRCPIFFGRKT